jgi:hypothetical protein
VDVLATVAALRPPAPGIPAPPNFRVFRYGVVEDMDDDDDHPVIVNGQAFWGLDSIPEDIREPADVGLAGLSLAASLGAASPAARAARLATDISDVLNGIDLRTSTCSGSDPTAVWARRSGRGDRMGRAVRDRPARSRGTRNDRGALAPPRAH